VRIAGSHRVSQCGNAQTDDLGEDDSDVANDSAKSKGFVAAPPLFMRPIRLPTG
jgi:hypothetical protein